LVGLGLSPCALGARREIRDPNAPSVSWISRTSWPPRGTGDDPTLWTQLAADEAGLNAFVKSEAAWHLG
jgi:hypothetical protein